MKSPHGMIVCSTLLLLCALAEPVSADAVRTDPLGGTGGGPIDGSLHVTVVYDGTTTPVPGAFVMAGSMPHFPFPHNWGMTSASGEITFTHPDLQGPIAVTVGAAGYQYFSIMSVDAADLVLALKPLGGAGAHYQVGDYVSGIDVDNGIFHAGDGNVDMAFVVPAMTLSELMAFDMNALFGPPEVIEVLGEPFEVPSNFFIPQQWELFIEIIKDHYYLYLPVGDYTLIAISGRISTEDLLGGGEIQDLLPHFQWRETDLLDITVSGDTNGADLNVGPDLSTTVTINLANVPDNSLAFCMSAGDLDGLAGLGRLVPMGVNSLDCPGGSGPCAGSVSLSTTAASGEFAGMTYFPVVAIDFNDTDDMVVLVDRTPRPRTYTATMSSFFGALDLAYQPGTFSWNDVANPGIGSPPVHVQTARIKLGDVVQWEFLLPGEQLSFEAPLLPPDAPPSPIYGDLYTWDQVSLGLAYELPSFDFDAFAFSDILAHGSHLSLDTRDITFGPPSTDVPGTDATAAFALEGCQPNPFAQSTVIRFELARPAPVELSIFGVDGRRVADLTSGWRNAGCHRAEWRGLNDAGSPVPGGMYYARLRTGGQSVSRSVIVLR